MKILFGGVPALEEPDAEAEELHLVRGPGKTRSLWIATFTGFLLILPLAGICLLLSLVAIPGTPIPPQPVDWPAAFTAIICYIPLHELLHLVWHPRFGASDQSFLVIWPTRLQFGVYYEGCMSRARWLVMRLAPLVLLSLIPVMYDAIFQYVAFTKPTKTFLDVVILLNCVGSGADVAACFVVLSQVPRSALLCFRRGRAYWKDSTAQRCTSPAAPAAS